MSKTFDQQLRAAFMAGIYWGMDEDPDDEEVSFTDQEEAYALAAFNRFRKTLAESELGDAETGGSGSERPVGDEQAEDEVRAAAFSRAASTVCLCREEGFEFPHTEILHVSKGQFVRRA